MITRDELIKIDRSQLTEEEESFLGRVEDLIKKAYMKGENDISVTLPFPRKIVVSRIVKRIKELGYDCSYTYSPLFGDCVYISWGERSSRELDESGY
jgi:hypothetical protein